MTINTILLVIALIGFYGLFAWYVWHEENRKEEKYKNCPPELWRVENWHLIDKVRVYEFLKEDLKKIKMEQKK